MMTSNTGYMNGDMLTQMASCLMNIRDEQARQRQQMSNLELHVLKMNDELHNKLGAIQETLNTVLQKQTELAVSVLQDMRNPAGEDAMNHPATFRQWTPHSCESAPRPMTALVPHGIPKPHAIWPNLRRKLELSIANRQRSGLFALEPDRNSQVFVTLMEELNLEINRSTTAAISSVSQVTAQPPDVPCLDTVLLLDVSESMKGEPFAALKQFVGGFLAELAVAQEKLGFTERVAVIMCSAATVILQSFTTDYDSINGILDSVTLEGRTPLMTALTMTLCYMELQGNFVRTGSKTMFGPRVIIVSDFLPTSDIYPFEGNDSESSAGRIQILQKLFVLAKKYKDHGYTIHCVPVGKNRNTQLASDLAENSNNGNVYEETDYRSVACYLRYQAVVGLVVDNMERNEDIDVVAHLQDIVANTDGLNQETDGDNVSKLLLQDKYCGSDDVNDQNGDLDDLPGPAQTGIQPGNQVDIQPGNEVDIQAGNQAAILPPWKATKTFERYSMEEIGGLPIIGSRVRRGPDWSYPDDLDGNGPGTVILHIQKGVVMVNFDNGKIGTFYYGENNKHDVQKVHAPRGVRKGHIEIGCSVQRGPDWNRGDEDGGSGTDGIVIRKLEDRVVMVRWPSRVIDTYKFGKDNKWELVVTPVINNVVSPDQSTAHGQNMSSVSSQYGSSFHNNTSQLSNSHSKNVAWWSYQDQNERWRSFSMEAVADLERKYHAKQTQALIQYQNRGVKVFFSDMTCEINEKKRAIKREMLNEDDILSMLAIEQMLPS